MYVKVKDLPEILQSVLKQIGYHKSDIQISIKEKVSVLDSGGQGRRGFYHLVNLSTNEVKSEVGNWGGANIFNPNNRIDLDDKKYEIPENIAVILGSEGYSGTYASITFSPKNILHCLPESEEISDEDKRVLAIFRSYTSNGRKEYLSGKDSIVDDLVKRGFLKRSKNGATSLTISGKNACENVRV